MYLNNNPAFTMFTLKETGKRHWLNESTSFSHFWNDYTRLVINGIR
jgi:hypothetical protein